MRSEARRGLLDVQNPLQTSPETSQSPPNPVRESKVTVKIPRPLYRKIQAVVEGSGFNSPTDFIVYVLRDLMGEHDAATAAHGGTEQPWSEEELDALKRKLKNLGYL